MPRYIVERAIPGAGDITDLEWQCIAQRSCDVVRELSGDVQWLESFVTADKTFCVYIATSEAKVREHATLGGLPATAISEVSAVIDPTTAEAPAAV